MASAIHAVLCDAFLLAHIVRFQRGLPLDFVQLARAHRAEMANGIAPLVARYGDLRMLQRLHACSREQPAYFARRVLAVTWMNALIFKHLDMACWLDSEPRVAAQVARLDPLGTTLAALASGDIDVVEWLVMTHPKLADRSMIQCCVTWLARRERSFILEWLA